MRQERIALAKAEENPTVLVRLISEILADDQIASMQTADGPGYREPIPRYLSRRFDKVLAHADPHAIRTAGRNNSENPTARETPLEHLRWARQWPFAKDRVSSLMTRAVELSNQGNYSDALLFCDEVLDTTKLDSRNRLAALLMLEKLYGSLDLERSRSQVLDELAISFGNDALDGSTSVAQYVAAERKKVTIPPLIVGFMPAWVTRDPDTQLIVPRRSPPSDRLAGAVVIGDTRGTGQPTDHPPNDETTIRYCRLGNRHNRMELRIKGLLRHRLAFQRRLVVCRE